MQNSFIFYSSFYEAINDLPDDVQLQLYKAIAGYSLEGDLPELTGLSKTIFTLIKPQIDANRKRYTDGCKGGRPKKKTTGSENKKTTGSENKKPNYNENDNDNVNENDNENQNVNIKPTNEEILAYANNQLCKRIDVNAFVQWYDAQGWIDKNGFPINWKQKVQSWVRKNKIENEEDDGYSSHDDSEWIKKLEQEEPETWKVLY